MLHDAVSRGCGFAVGVGAVLGVGSASVAGCGWGVASEPAVRTAAARAASVNRVWRSVLQRRVPRLDGAACVGEDPELWFSSERADQVAALRICHSCPVRERCAAFALDERMDDGIWGGLLESDRAQLLYERDQAARRARRAAARARVFEEAGR